MCGICGFVGAGSDEDLERMNARLIHRGPDGAGEWRDEQVPIRLASRRLAIIDLPGGTQPMQTPDGKLVVVFNGEIYNHSELRAELQQLGHRFQTDHSDTETLLLGYREWGADVVSHLNGMWAFAIYDHPRARLFCSRDRFGEKPFYYTKAKDLFAFASELTALIAHPGVRRNVSHRGLQKYFGYGYIPAPRSIFEGVSKLPAGCSLFFDVRSAEVKVAKYWDFELAPFSETPPKPEEEWGGRLRELLDRAVKRRLIADVPIGVFLSGGIDSSAVTAFASRHVGPGNLKTFSVGFYEKSFDESKFGALVSSRFETDHRMEFLSVERTHQIMGRCLAQLDEPLGDNSILPTYLLSEFTAKQVKVAIGGDGGDELFGGYDPFQALSWARWYDRLFPRPVHAAIKALFNRLPISYANIALDFKIKRALRGLDYAAHLWLPVWMAPVDRQGLQELFEEPIDLEDLYSEAVEQWEICKQTDLVDKTLQFYTKLYLQDDILMKVDRASMMHGLEVRAPFLDIELVDFVRRIPSRYKFRNGKTKFILKAALAGVLPREILRRRKKGFGTPLGAWIRNGALPVQTPNLPSLNRRFVVRQLSAHQLGKIDNTAFLWGCQMLDEWARANRVIV
jgi:asparagine synthase (glutamine-hydrolysing)